MTVPNAKLTTGTLITWTQYRTQGTTPGLGRERNGTFLALAPGRGTIWVRPSTPDPGEPFAIKIYRALIAGGPDARAVAYDDDLTAAQP